jgi:hypothetical protein
MGDKGKKDNGHDVISRTSAASGDVSQRMDSSRRYS